MTVSARYPWAACISASSRTRSESGASAGRRSASCSRTRTAQLAAARREDLLEQLVAADRPDRGEESRRQRVVRGREEVLGIGGDVVEVARPPDAVLHRLAAHEARRLERTKLLEDAGPARAQAHGKLVGRRRAVEAEAKEQVAPQAGRTGRPAPPPRLAEGPLWPRTEKLGSGIREG